MLRISLAIVLTLHFAFILKAQDVYDARQSVRIEALIQEQVPMITLNWVLDTANGGYTIWRKQKEDTQWMDSMTSLNSYSTSWSDTSVVAGRAYEYQLIKSLPAFPYGNGTPNFGSGYICSGIQLSPVHHRGSCLVVIDSSLKQGLQFELDRLKQDLEEDGWQTQLIYVQKNETVQQIKSKIKTWSSARKDIHQALFLLGRIPVPYAGDIAPDGHHSDHRGAWPCDGYYADLDGSWTDSLVNNTSAPGSRNDNKPNDGKFDQTRIPAPVKLQVGRVDFSNMNKFPETEEQLIKRYLDKNHLWRKGISQAEERALVDNNFRDVEGLGSVAWMNFTPMFGIGKVKDLPYRQTLQNQSYMWSYGCGGGGPESASDISSTTSFASDSLKTVFTLLFGSYFGDWDYPDNFLRAAIASRTCLASAWGNRPHWFLHHMAMGETIGYSSMLTMNNRGLYTPAFYGGYIHTALMGDPTLKMHNLPPIENLKIVQKGMHIQLEWEDPNQSEAHFVYKKSHPDSGYALIHTQPININHFTDSCVANGLHQYMIRSVKLQRSASGSFYNLSSGVSDFILCNTAPYLVSADFQTQIYFDELKIINNSFNAQKYFWDFGDGSQSMDFEPVHLYRKSGDWETCLFASNECGIDTFCQLLQIRSSLPQVIATIKDANCFGTATGSIQLQLNGGSSQHHIMWMNRTDTGKTLQNIHAGDYACIIKSETGNSDTYGPFKVSQEKEWKLNPTVKNTEPGKSNGSINLDPIGGCPPYTYQWNTGQSGPKIVDLDLGVYCVSISDCKNCTYEFCAEIKLASHVESVHRYRPLQLFPNPANEQINIELDQPMIQHYDLNIINTLGKKVDINQILIQPNNLILDISPLPDGPYWIQIKGRNEIIQLAFIKISH